ncbi:MAG TPA: FG-GAP-like repeat-containing protein [Thermoanaerobaculia bacterium]|jgi:hypothetical protein|nr:FG-GAP-like repeat-containing protein [Thermoanaerobaculia bacterium]
MRPTVPGLALLVALSLATSSFAAECESVLVDGIRLHLPGANALVALDVDHDARPDLVAASETGTELTVWLNRADGFFRDTPIAVGHNVLRLYEADLDGDGDRDIVAAGRNNISTLFANANGTLTKVTSTAHDLHTISALGDLTADGQVDLAALDNDRRLRVYRGNANGTFTLIGTPTEPLGAPWIYSMEVAELTGDTFGDVVVAGDFGLAIVRGNGDGTFAPPRSLSPFDAVQSIVTDDFDGDGRADILGSNPELLYSSKNNHTIPKLAVCVGNALAADLDGDGKLDAISDGLRVCRGNGDGTFTQSWTGATHLIDQVSPSETATAADFNRDGMLDLAGAAANGDIAVFFAKPDLQFAGSRDYVTTLARYIDTADLNGDGLDDIITSGSYANVFLANAAGTFTKTAALLVHGPTATADLNGDGKLDLFFAPGTTYLGNGDGTFQATSERGSSRYGSITAIDVNGDQKTDFVASAIDYSTDDMASVFLRSDGGTLTETRFPTGHAQLIDLVVADVNGDSFPDLLALGNVVDNDEYGTLRMLPGRGDGTFGASVLIAERVTSDDVIATRIDGDAHPDLAVAINTAETGDTIIVFRGAGSGAFIERQRIALPNDWNIRKVRLQIGDFNGDGRRDLVVVDGGLVPEIQVLLQTEHGLFAPGWMFPWNEYDLAAAVGDFNNDGIDDLTVLASTTLLDVHLATCSDTLLARPARVHLYGPARAAKDTPVTFTAVVDASNPGGSVAFYDKDRFLDSAPVIGGRASLTTTFASVDRHKIHAIYSGDGPLSRVMSEVVMFDSVHPTGVSRRRASRR